MRVGINGEPIRVTLDVDHIVGAYGKFILPVADQFSLYGLLGFTRAKATAEAAGFKASSSEDDFSYGVGAEFHVTPQFGVGAEWARLLDKRDFKLDGIAITANWRF